MTKAWLFPKISHDLAYALCDYLRDQNYFDILINWFVKPTTCETGKLTFPVVLFVTDDQICYVTNFNYSIDFSSPWLWSST